MDALAWYLGGVVSLAVALALSELLTGSGCEAPKPKRVVDRLHPPDDVNDFEWMYAETPNRGH